MKLRLIGFAVALALMATMALPQLSVTRTETADACWWSCYQPIWHWSMEGWEWDTWGP